MIRTKLRRPLLVIAALLLLAVAGLLFLQPATPASAGNAIPLQAPPFQDAASPEDAAALAAIGDEAGIAAYFNAGSQINLASVRDRFRTIEAETANYIVGSVDVADYAESFDVHAYVHRNGWFMAYYLEGDPASKIVDILAYQGGTSVGTHFDEVLTILASEAGVTFPGATYWHFRYPNANRLMIIVEDDADGDTFTVKLPSSFIFSELAWMVHGPEWILNGENLAQGVEDWARVGVIGPAQMPLDTVHEIRLCMQT